MRGNGTFCIVACENVVSRLVRIAARYFGDAIIVRRTRVVNASSGESLIFYVFFSCPFRNLSEIAARSSTFSQRYMETPSRPHTRYPVTVDLISSSSARDFHFHSTNRRQFRPYSARKKKKKKNQHRATFTHVKVKMRDDADLRDRQTR